MSSGITLTAATRQNLLSLQGTADLLTQTQNRLSTGKKVNSALDDPTSFFTSQALSGRSGDLGNLLNGISNGIQTIQAANQGITSIQKLVDSAKSTASQALADKSGATTGTPATAAALTSTVAYQGTAGANADGTRNFSASQVSEFTITDGVSTGNSATITLSAATLKGVASDLTKVSSDDIVKAINNQLSNAGSTKPAVIASKNTNGQIVLTSTALGADAQVNVTRTANNNVDIGFGATASGSLAAVGADQTSGGTRAAAIGSAALANTVFTTTDTSSITISLNGGAAKTITLGTADFTAPADAATAGTATPAEMVRKINQKIGLDADLKGKVTASIDPATNALSIKTVGTGKASTLTVANAAGVTDSIGFATPVSVTGTDAVLSSSSSSTRATLAAQFNSLREQITQQAKDSSYNGVNLLYRSGSSANENTLKVTFNETRSSSLSISGTKLDADGLGLTAVTGNFQSDDEINTTLTALTTATSQLRAQSSTFGSNLSIVQNRQDFSKNLINILDTGAANLTNADLNEEAANSQALSTRQSIGISALSLANTAQQGILQLLR